MDQDCAHSNSTGTMRTLSELEHAQQGWPVDHDASATLAGPGNSTQMLEYWDNPTVTSGMRRQGWIMTGDQATVDADAYIRFLGHHDDMIASAG